MLAIKSGGKVIGAHLTNAERKAMDIEIQKQQAVREKQFEDELDALILYQIHRQTGYGAKRLRKFYEDFRAGHNELIERYELGNADLAWYATERLKEIGVDISAWNDEIDAKMGI